MVAQPKVERVATGAGWILIALALIVISGWALHIPALMSVAPGLATMKPNTAAAFLLTGLALVRRNGRNLRFYSLGVLVLGAVTLIEYLSNTDFGIDQRLFRDPYSTSAPGRMSVITSVAFILLGSALLLMKAPSETGRKISRVFGLLSGALGFIAILGYSYDTQALYQVRPYSSIALHTAIAFVIAAIGVQYANPTEGLVGKLHGDSAGGAMLRQLLPAALLIPYLLGFIAWLSHKHFGWEMGFSLALVIAATILCLAILMLLNAKRLEAESIALRESEQRFRVIANAAPVMIWMSGPDKLCNYFNQSWLAFTGRALETELGSGWTEGVHPEDLGSRIFTSVAAFNRQEPIQMQYRLRRYDGEYRWILDTCVPRLNQDGSFSGYIGCCIDITDRQLAEEALADVGRRLIEAQEEERTRIARELHDDINQRLALLAIELGTWNQNPFQSGPEVRDRIRQLQRRVSDISKDIQALSHRLHSSKLDYLGIVAATDSFCTELSQQQKVEIDFSQEGVPHNVPKNVSLCLFRVLQEALQNAVKHSGVRHFTVELKGDQEEIQLTVSDQGVGFDQQTVVRHHGLGLISMRERLQSVNGEFSIKSEPGRGTTVKACVPFKKETGATGPDLASSTRTA